MWDGTAGRELVRWEAHEATVTALAFNSDGRMLVSGADDGTVRLWDLPALRRDLAALGLGW